MKGGNVGGREKDIQNKNKKKKTRLTENFGKKAVRVLVTNGKTKCA